MTATIFEAKTNLSELIQLAAQGEDVVITSGREKVPVARVVPVEPVTPKRLGVCYDPTFELGDAFWQPLPKVWSGEASDDLAV